MPVIQETLEWLQSVVAALGADDAAALEALYQQPGGRSTEERLQVVVVSLSKLSQNLNFGAAQGNAKGPPLPATGPLADRKLGDTALHLAAANDRASCVAVLLRLGANPKTYNKMGQLPKGRAPKGSAAAKALSVTTPAPAAAPPLPTAPPLTAPPPRGRSSASRPAARTPPRGRARPRAPRRL